MNLLKENKKIKNFKVLLDDGSKQELKNLVGKKGIILYFYPKDNTPGCTKEACSFRDHLQELENLGFSVLGVSADSLKSHQNFKNKHNLNFPLIVDENKELCQYFGVWGEKKMYGKTTQGIFRTTFILDTDLKIKKVYPNVKVENHISEILNDIQNL
ncbi:MAG: thioredoxin-dependent thiol peroxidase [Leptonema sp. (in: bacteria)]